MKKKIFVFAIILIAIGIICSGAAYINGSLSQLASGLYWNESNSNLGINKVPIAGYALDVNGIIRSTTLAITGSAIYGQSGVQNQKIGFGANGHYSVQVSPGQVYVFFIKQGPDFFTGIGPGNITPESTLHVFDTTAITGSTNLKIQEGAGQSTDEAFGVYANNGTTPRLTIADGNTTVYGRLNGTKGADVASANDITLGIGNYFDITGTTEIQRILGTSWTIGSIVILQFDGSVQVTHGTAEGSSYYGFQLSGGSNFSATANDTLMVIFDGAWWREISRTVI